MKSKIIMYMIVCVMLFTYFIPVQPVFADISSVGKAAYVNEQIQNNDALQDEQLIVKTNGSILSIEGRTQLPPLEEDDVVAEGMYVANFLYFYTDENGEKKTTQGTPYLETDYYVETGANGKPVYVFSGSCDFSKKSDGNYLMYLWRAGKGHDKKYKLGSKYGKGMLSYDVVVRVKSGKVSIVQYDSILNENIAVKEKMNAEGTEGFLDTSLKDIFFVNRDPQVSGDKGKALTSEQMVYIKSKAEEITADCQTDYEKVKTIYEFAADNVYYDTYRDSGSKAFTNPYWNLYNICEKKSNSYNASKGKVATECTGYSAMVVSMARAIGIPTRLVNGRHPAIEKEQWPEVSSINKVNHYWAECYVDDRWVIVDATMGTQSKYNSSKKTWTSTGISNYTYFDPTDQQFAVHYLAQGIYEVPASVITNVTGLKTADRSTSSIKVSWSAMKGASGLVGYFVQCYSTSGKRLRAMHVKSSTRSYEFKELGPGNTYIVYVSGYGFDNGEKIYGKKTKLTTCTIPAKTTIKQLTTGKKHYVKVTWSKKTCSGYQVMLSTNSKFTKDKKTVNVSNKYVSKTISKLKKGKYYYLKVRPYKTLGSKKYYGSWSSPKKIKCK